MSCPHRFDSIISGDALPLLLAGTGLSYPELQTKDLIPRLRKSPETARCLDPLKCLAGVKGVAGCLYCLAEQRLIELGLSTSGTVHPRFSLAEEIGLFDERWLARTALPLRQNFARHRAIARLAADRRLHSIVSLNWDLYLEAAFEAAGIERDVVHPAREGFPIGGFTVVVRDEHQAHTANQSLFPIVKPHGCCFDLDHQRREQPTQEPVLKITHSDLEALKANNDDVTQAIRRDLKGRSLVTVGWSASEPYLRLLIQNLSGNLPTSQSDRLSVVIKEHEWSARHDEVAHCYASNETSAAFGMENEKTTDKLFLWIYAQFALQRLAESILPSLKDVSARLSALETEMDDPTHRDWCYGFFDDFLPTWSRLCWRMGGVSVFRKGAAMPPHQVPAGPQDWHIPFNTHPNSKQDEVRPDLAAAAILLHALDGLSKPLAWDLSAFPGALWHAASNQLAVPVPLFVPSDGIETLGSFDSLVEMWRYGEYFNRIQNPIRLLLLGPAGDFRSVPTSIWQPLLYRFSVDIRRPFPHASLASAEHVVVDSPMGLDQL